MQKYTRLATKNDISNIMLSIDDAIAFLKQSGSTQWQNGYPNQKVIEEDIANKNANIANNEVQAKLKLIEGLNNI